MEGISVDQGSLKHPVDTAQSIKPGGGQPSNDIASLDVQLADAQTVPNARTLDMELFPSAQPTPKVPETPDMQKASDDGTSPNEFFFGPDDLERHRQLRRWLDARSTTPSAWGFSDSTSTGNVRRLENVLDDM